MCNIRKLIEIHNKVQELKVDIEKAKKNQKTKSYASYTNIPLYKLRLYWPEKWI